MLPVLNIIKQDITLPDSKLVIKVRPYLTGEEKGLLMAIESQKPDEMQEAIRNLVQTCILTPDIKIDNFSFLDLEYIFITLRKISVGPIVTLSIFHQEESECEHIQKVNVKLDDMKISGQAEKKIILSADEGIGIVMKTPTVKTLESLGDGNTIEKTFEMIYNCVDYVFDAENVYKDFSKEDLKKWVDQLNESQLRKIIDFFETIPKIKYDIKYTCVCGKVEERTIEGILSFL